MMSPLIFASILLLMSTNIAQAYLDLPLQLEEDQQEKLLEILDNSIGVDSSDEFNIAAVVEYPPPSASYAASSSGYAYATSAASNTKSPNNNNNLLAAILYGPTPSLKSPSEKFAQCCGKEELKKKTIADACRFPPADKLTWDDQVDVAIHFPGYIGCYANHKNNRACCDKNGVAGIFAVCQDLCDGEHPPPEADIKYVICTKSDKIKAAISACNKAAYGPGLLLPALPTLPVHREPKKVVHHSLVLQQNSLVLPRCPCNANCGHRETCHFCHNRCVCHCPQLEELNLVGV